MKDRKNELGKKNILDLQTVSAKTRLSLQGIPTLENQAIHILEELGLVEVKNEKKARN